MALMHLTNTARARCLYFEEELKKLEVNVQALARDNVDYTNRSTVEPSL